MKYIKIFGVILTSILMSSCMKQEITQSIDENWASSIEAKITLNMQTSVTSSWVTDEPTMCKDYNESEYVFLKGINCVQTNKTTAEIKWNSDLVANKMLYSSWNIYAYNIANIAQIMSKKTNEISSDSQDSNSDANIAQMKQMGFEIKYNFIFPWEIVKSWAWTYTWNLLSVDWFVLMKQRSAIVIFKKAWTEVSEAEILEAINSPLVKVKKIPSKLKVLTEKQRKIVISVFAKKRMEELSALTSKINTLIGKLLDTRSYDIKTNRKISILEDINLIISDLQ